MAYGCTCRARLSTSQVLAAVCSAGRPCCPGDYTEPVVVTTAREDSYLKMMRAWDAPARKSGSLTQERPTATSQGGAGWRAARGPEAPHRRAPRQAPRR